MNLTIGAMFGAMYVKTMWLSYGSILCVLWLFLLDTFYVMIFLIHNLLVITCFLAKVCPLCATSILTVGACFYISRGSPIYILSSLDFLAKCVLSSNTKKGEIERAFAIPSDFGV